MQVAPGVHHFDTGPFNWYVVEASSRLTLIDAGFPGHYMTFLDGIRSLGRDLKDLEAIVLTHAHADHIGFAERVRKETGVPVYVHRDDLLKSQRVLQLPWFGLLSNAWRPYTASMLGNAMFHGVFTFPAIGKAIGFDDGAVLEVPGRPQVIHVPGHTPGEVALFFPDRNVLVSGDTLVTRNLFTGEEGAPAVPSRFLNANDRLALRSIDRLSEIGTVTMLPGHGRPWTGTMKDAIAIARERGIDNRPLTQVSRAQGSSIAQKGRNS